MSKILIITGDGGGSYEALLKPGWDMCIDGRGYGLEAGVNFDDVRVEAYAAVLVLGGRAPEYLRNNANVIELVRDRQEKWVFAICHGVQALAAAGWARGRRVTRDEHVRREYREIFVQVSGEASAARS